MKHVMAHYQPVVNPSVFQIIFLYLQLCYMRRDRRRWVHLSWERAFKGLPPSPETGGAGVYPFVGSRSTFYGSIAIAKELGIFIENEEGQVAVNFSVRMSDLIEHEQVQLYSKKAMPRSWGATEEGRAACATLLDQHTLSAYRQPTPPSPNAQAERGSASPEVSRKDCSNACDTSRTTEDTGTTTLQSTATASRSSRNCRKAGRWMPFSAIPMTLSLRLSKLLADNGFSSRSDYNRTGKASPSSDKSSEGPLDRFCKPERWFYMPPLDDLRNSILSAVSAKQDKVREKRRTRMGINDLSRLFEQAWQAGQKEANPSVPPVLVISKADRRILKDRIITPFREAGMDVEEFARWVALHWNAIGGNYFRKSKSYPERPAFRWLVSCLPQYVDAFEKRDTLNPDLAFSRADIARKHKAYEEQAQALQSTATKFKARETDLKRQLEEAHAEIERLRDQRGEEDPDPVYRKVRKLASRKTVFGRFD